MRYGILDEESYIDLNAPVIYERVEPLRSSAKVNNAPSVSPTVNSKSPQSADNERLDQQVSSSPIKAHIERSPLDEAHIESPSSPNVKRIESPSSPNEARIESRSSPKEALIESPTSPKEAHIVSPSPPYDWTKDASYAQFVKDMEKLIIKSQSRISESVQTSSPCFKSLKKELIFSPMNLESCYNEQSSAAILNSLKSLQPQTSTPRLSFISQFASTPKSSIRKPLNFFESSPECVVKPAQHTTTDNGTSQVNVSTNRSMSQDSPVSPGENFSPVVEKPVSPFNWHLSNQALKSPSEEQLFKPTRDASLSISSSNDESGSSRASVEEETAFKALTPVEILDSLAEYYRQETKYKRDLEKRIREYEEKTDSSQLSQIKRTIMEKITISSKKHASKEDIEDIATYFANLSKGIKLAGINESELKLSSGVEVFYMMNQACERYLKLAEHDQELCLVVARVLVSIGSQVEAFLKIVLGRLFSSCIFLTMNPVRCLKRAEWLCAQPTEARKIYLDEQKALLRVFFTMHTLVLEEGISAPRLTFKNIWRALAYTTNAPPVPLATPIVLNELLQTCGKHLFELYGSVMRRTVNCIREELLDKLDEQVSTNQLLMKAGQATQNSILRSNIEAFY